MLLAAYTLSDYFPLTPGATWSYSGTVFSDAATASASVASGPTLNGQPTRRLQTIVNAPNLPETLSRYYTLDSAGLLLHRESTTEWTETHSPAFSLLPATVTTNTTYQLATSYTGLGTDGAYTGSATGTFTVLNIESVVTPKGTFDALHIQFNDSYDEIGNNNSYTETGTVDEDLWLARGLGIVRQDVTRVSYNSLSPIGDAFVTSLKLTASNLFVPEITVTGNDITIADGDTTPSTSDFTDFGTTQLNFPTSFTFRVTNSGLTTLTTSTLSIPAGFTLIDGLAPTITAGNYDDITLGLNADTLGTKSGQLSFTTNDADEATFNFSITGKVTPNSPPVGSIDVFSRQTISGWVFDPDAPAVPAYVSVSIDGVTQSTFAAESPRPDVNAAFGLTGGHGFSYSLPTLTEGPHTVAVYTLDSPSGDSALLQSATLVAPSRFFDETFYLQTNPDVAAAVSSGALPSGWDHFWSNGQYEGRQPNSTYDESYYRAANPDVAAAIGPTGFKSGFEHFWFNGAAENRRPSLLFHPGQYLNLNPDVASAVLAGAVSSGYEHYFLFGRFEAQRNPSIYFDTAYYLQQNTDVAAALQNLSLRSAIDHYVQFGMNEGRIANRFYTESYYLSQNTDVAAAVASHAIANGYQHYLLYGQYETTRKASLDFDATYYLAHNPDVNQVWLNHQIDSPFEHYLLWGQYEGRVAHA